MAKINAINNKSEELTIDPGASGDSFVQFDINGTGEFRIGVDDTDDSFRISQGSALGTNDTFIVTDAGNITKPLNSCCSAYCSAQTNVSGDNTLYSITFTGGEYFDQNGNFASSTFTAPVTGKFLMTIALRSGDWTTSYDYYYIQLNTTARNYILFGGNGGNIADGAGELYGSCSAIVDTTVADTATVSFLAGNSSKAIDIDNGFFAVCLVS